MNRLSENDLYYTADLSLATTLSLWYPVEHISKLNPRKAEFCFKRDQELDKLIEGYWRGEVRVEPQAYFNQLRVIKARLYQE